MKFVRFFTAFSQVILIVAMLLMSNFLIDAIRQNLEMINSNRILIEENNAMLKQLLERH